MHKNIIMIVIVFFTLAVTGCSNGQKTDWVEQNEETLYAHDESYEAADSNEVNETTVVDDEDYEAADNNEIEEEMFIDDSPVKSLFAYNILCFIF